MRIAGTLRLVLATGFALASALSQASPLGPDGVPGHVVPGKFVWFDLATEDVAGARAFYGSVFGWTFRDAHTGKTPYTLIEHAGGGKVGGMFRQSRPPGAPVGSRWLSVISVKDPASVAQRVRQRGGQVIVAPVTVPDRGIHAVFRDPQGAVFGVLAASGGDRADQPVSDGDVFWVDLFARDPQQAAAFYGDVIGYEISESEATAGRKRVLLAAADVARAGIVALPAGSSAVGWLPYILVDDVPATLARTRSAGGKVVVAPRADLLDRKLAVIADPSGGVIGIVDWEPREGAAAAR